MDIALRIAEAVIINDDAKVKLKLCKEGDDVVIHENTLRFNLHSSIFPSILDPSSIVVLDLTSCNLKYLPDDLKDLPLKELNVSKNAFAEVPKCIRNGLRFLQVLNISYNKLSYFDAPECMMKLRVLKIDHNNLTNVPVWILMVYALNLEEFDFSHNCVTSLKLSKFHYTPMYRLNKLELRNCELRIVDFTQLKTISTLKHLDIGNDESTENLNSFLYLSQLFVSPDWIGRLKVLCLNYLHMSDLPVEISNLLALEELYLTNNELLWLPESFLVPNLQLLDISFNRMTILPKNLCEMCNLRILRLQQNCLESLPKFPPHLEELDLYQNKLDAYSDNENCLLKLDLEMNYFDTSSIDEYDRYLTLKASLRDGRKICRCDGFNSLVVTDDEDSDRHSDYESDYDKDVVECSSIAVEEWDEEPWDSGCGNVVGDVGCSTSDNEFTGYEEVKPRQVVQKVPVQNYDWVFADISSDEHLDK
ncbi:hypothetical protein RI129_007044 [Pyrocoelia pectoralis]|uniref:Uncharacterized protein n=1 Tax=Pyrocoelia pectoralis TaxID=417401 RepID=A0AAN7VFU6_9COLE